MSVWEARYSPLWTVFSDIIRFRSNLRINIKLHLFFLGVHFAYRKMPFSLKNVRATFQRAMNLIFHNLKMIIKVYLNDLAAHSHLRVCHPYHMRSMFKRCFHYQVRLNPHKCIFCVSVGRLLGFIVSKEGIRVDPLKWLGTLPPPSMHIKFSQHRWDRYRTPCGGMSTLGLSTNTHSKKNVLSILLKPKFCTLPML